MQQSFKSHMQYVSQDMETLLHSLLATFTLVTSYVTVVVSEGQAKLPPTSPNSSTCIFIKIVKQTSQSGRQNSTQLNIQDIQPHSVLI